jgi:hypothetical protein
MIHAKKNLYYTSFQKTHLATGCILKTENEWNDSPLVGGWLERNSWKNLDLQG